MHTLTAHKKKEETLNMVGVKELVNKHKKIDHLFESGKAIDQELTKGFVTFPISSNPYKR